MNAPDVVSLYQSLDALGIQIWIDGGWAVDALVRRQTRIHEDLDVVVQVADLAGARAFLEQRGYIPVERDDTSPWNFVLGDSAGRLVDLHVITLHADGSGQYGPAHLGESYPAGSLDGIGSISGQIVRCIAPEHLVAFHTGYTPRAIDVHDVALLGNVFGIPLPDGYAALAVPDSK